MPPDPPRGLSRREFLAAANAAAFLLLLESCSLGPIGRVAAKPSIPPGGSLQEKALKLLLQAVRASPDHLAQRSADLVAAKDASKIVAFVQDSLSVLPTLGAGDDPVSGMRWGSSATLRGGQGTLRERAEVLADLLNRAGFKAEVKSAKRPDSLALGELYQPRTTGFAPDQSRLDLARTLLSQAGATPAASPQALDVGADPAAAVLAALPASLQKAKVRGDLLPDRLPLVTFTDAGKTRYAFAVGGQGVTDTPPAGLGNAFDPDPFRKVTVTVSGLTNPPFGSQTPRGQVIDLVTAEWPADQVVGNQVLLTFMPPQGPLAVLQSGLSRLPVRIPTLRLQTPAPAGGANPVAMGSLVTVQGDVLGPSTTQGSPSPDAPIQGPYGTIKALSPADRAAAIASAKSIHVIANAAAFPEVELEVAVADGAGAAVDGLDVSSFTVADNSAAIESLALYSNVQVQPRPRVLIVSDAGSADLWPSAAVKSAFESGIDSALVSLAAKTPFDVQVAVLGSAPVSSAWSPPQAGSISGPLSSAHESADDPWISVCGSALDQGVGAIVVISDMNSVDTDKVQLDTYQRRLAAAHVPVIALPIGAVDEQTTSTILSLSGGSRLDPTDAATPGKVASLIQPPLSAWIGGGYRLRYRANTAGPSQRAVTVNLSGRPQPQGTATYAVPDKPLPPPSFSGLYVTVTFGLYSTVRRIAGLPARARGAPERAVDDPAAVAETRAALDGVTTIAIEPGTSTAGALLGDVLSSLLSIEPLRAIWPTAKPEDILKALPNGVLRTPAVLAELLSANTVAAGGLPELRVAILQERQMSPGTVEQHIDIAPALNPVLPVGADPAAAFRAVVATSVSASIAEAAAFDDSALLQLKGQRLAAIAAGDFQATVAFLNSVPAEKRDAWSAVLALYDGNHMLVPAAGAADALWVVDPASGTTVAVRLDGSGGAILTECTGPNNLDLLNAIVALLGLLCTFGIVAAPWFCIGLTVLSVGIMVVQLFTEDFTATTPFGVMSTIFGTGSKAKAIGGRFGVAGVVLLLLAISLEC